MTRIGSDRYSREWSDTLQRKMSRDPSHVLSLGVLICQAYREER